MQPFPRLSNVDRFRTAWQRRHTTDYIFEVWSAIGWIVLTLGIFNVYVYYQLARRMRDHNLRRLELLDAALQVGWEETQRQGLEDELTPSFQRASAQLEDMKAATENVKDPNVWLIMMVVGFLFLIAVGAAISVILAILLDGDLIKHDRSEIGVEYELSQIYRRLGYVIPHPDEQRVKSEHNYIARVIVYIVTFTIYGFWWTYNLMDEPNRHFRTNWEQEDGLALAVQAIGKNSTS